MVVLPALNDRKGNGIGCCTGALAFAFVARSWRQVSSFDIPASAITAVVLPRRRWQPGGFGDRIPGSTKKQQPKWRSAGILRALVEHPASRPLGVY